MGSEKEQTGRLLTPSLYEVRHHQVGKFIDYAISIPKSKKQKAIFHIKTTTHPKWFEQKHATNQVDLYISQKAVDLLKRDGKISKRWSRKRQWRKKKNSGKEKGEYIYKSRTPKGTVWIAASQRTDGQKGKSGRKAGGMAYKVRREAWRILANQGQISKLLKEPIHSLRERKPTGKIPLRIPNLSAAIEEIIISEIWPNLHDDRERVVNEWLNLNGVRSFLKKQRVDDELCDKFAKGILSDTERNKIIHLVCNRNWKAILARWIELKVLTSMPSTNPKTDQTTVSEQTIESKCDPYCVGQEFEYDRGKGEIWCQNCGLVARQFTSEERILYGCDDVL